MTDVTPVLMNAVEDIQLKYDKSLKDMQLNTIRLFRRWSKSMTSHYKNFLFK